MNPVFVYNMKKTLLSIVVILFSSVALAKKVKPMSVESTSWKDGQTITEQYVFNGFGCSGQNISPQVSWKNLPRNTRSVAVTIYDPDAPTGSGWWHWLTYNIPMKVKSLPEGEGKQGTATLSNTGVQNLTDFGVVGYGGPCPPAGHPVHHYVLTVHAIDVEKLDIPANASGAMAGFFINQHTISKASLTGLYSRK
jgi:Raf kinase inhibitor-like YbhB/YbcL family protein